MKKTLAILLLAGSTLLGGCGDSEEFFFNDSNFLTAAPIARNDAYTTTQNVVVAIPAVQGVLTNDTINAGPNSNITVAYQPTTTQGGTVTITNNFGAFTYTPANGFVGSDSFTYTLSNGFSSATATVTITVNAAQVTQGYFVDSANGSDTNGSFQTGTPFQTIQAAVTAAGTNQDIVVRPGSYTGSIQLLNGQRLLGSGSGLVNAQGTVRPSLTGPVILADGNTVDFVRIANSPDDAINGDGRTSGTITNCELFGTMNSGSGVRIHAVTGEWIVEDNTIANISGLGIDMEVLDVGIATARFNRNNISDCTFDAISILSGNDGELAVQVNDNTLASNSTGATFEVISLGTSDICLQILGNENDDTYRFNRLDATSSISVEQFDNLQALNSGNATVTVDLFPVATVAEDFCGF